MQEYIEYIEQKVSSFLLLSLPPEFHSFVYSLKLVMVSILPFCSCVCLWMHEYTLLQIKNWWKSIGVLVHNWQQFMMFSIINSVNKVTLFYQDLFKYLYICLLILTVLSTDPIQSVSVLNFSSLYSHSTSHLPNRSSFLKFRKISHIHCFDRSFQLSLTTHRTHLLIWFESFYSSVWFCRSKVCESKLADTVFRFCMLQALDRGLHSGPIGLRWLPAQMSRILERTLE